MTGGSRQIFQMARFVPAPVSPIARPQSVVRHKSPGDDGRILAWAALGDRPFCAFIETGAKRIVSELELGGKFRSGECVMGRLTLSPLGGSSILRFQSRFS